MSEGVLHKFYCSKNWKDFRNVIIQERSKEGIKCEICGRFIFSSEEIHIHHTPIELTEHNYLDKMISLNPENVKLTCKSCHDKEHNRFCGYKKKANSVYVVCGPPMSGKTTYVEQNMSPGDLVIDMDKLYAAVSLREMYNKPDNLKYNVFAIKNLLINQIKTRYGNFKSAWIIGTYANSVERERLANDLGAEIIILDVCKEECIVRLDNCKDYRAIHKAEWISYIENYFENFS